MNKEIIRVIRIVVLEGERSWVEKTIIKSITGTKEFPDDDGKITSNKIHASTLGSFPEVLVRKNEIKYGCGVEKAPGEFSMFAGPYPTLEQALDYHGEIDLHGNVHKDSVIIKFNEDGTDIITHRWSSLASKWVEVKWVEVKNENL